MNSNLTRPLGFTLIELMIAVAIVAILAVVAVPQFTKYMRAAKAAEANQMLDLIKKGAATYYTTPRVTKDTGLRVQCQFPGKVGMTPAGASCCALDNTGDDRCDACAGCWNAPSWSALRFSISDEHYFQYTFNSSGNLKTARYTAQAHADLDCDTIMSTFQYVGIGDPAATFAECNAVGNVGIFSDLETE